MSDFFGSKKGKIITVIAALAVAIVILAIILLRKPTYRSILVEQVEGTVSVVGESNNGEAYAGQRLYSGDDVSVNDASSLTMCMDNDKYVYADANTHFSLVASSPREDSKIKIVLDAGSELNVLKSKLNPNDSYEVDTPNSTMSVRGTTFRVTVYTGEDGMVYTLLEVEEGVVLARLKTIDGTYNGVEKEFKAGESALIRGNDEFSEFVTDDEGEIIRHLDYDNLPEDSVERLIALLEDEELDDESEKDNLEEEDTKVEKTDDKDKASSENDSEEKTESTQKATEKTTEKATEKTTEKSEKKTTKKKSDKSDEDTEHTHSFGAWEVTKAATCTVDGSKQRKCSCGEVETETIPATGHNFGEWTIIIPQGCETSEVQERKCTNPGCDQTEQKTTKEALGHHWIDLSNMPTTEKESGRIIKRYCDRCSKKELQ
ncbi:MAG: hypothetical protein E7271_00650 [Lachnospiraceae bacterium]|jgi:hypothetical protein|nr:hypothetical protein [Lachnospiraceae bacterium]